MKQAHDQQPAGEPFRLAPLLFFAVIFFFNFLARMVFSPLLMAIKADFGVSHAEAGSFFLILSIGFSIMIFLSGFVSKRLLHRGTIILSVFGMGSALLLIALSNTLFLFKIGLCLLGMSAGLYIPSAVTTITNVTPPKHWGKAFSLHEFGGIAGFVLAPIFAEIGLRSGSWRLTLLLFGIGTLIVGIVYSVFGTRDGFRGDPPHFHTIKVIVQKRSFRILAVFFILGVGLESGVFAMLPTYLVTERGMERGFVNTIVGLSRSSALVLVFVSGWLGDRFGVKVVIGWITAFAGISTVLLGVLQGQWIIAVVFLQPLAISAFWPVGVTALSDLSPSRTRNVSVSVLVPFTNLFGAGLVPVAMGFLAERGVFAAGFIIIGSCMVLALLLLPRLDVSANVH